MSYTERSQVLEMVESGQMSVQDAIGMMSSAAEQPSASEQSFESKPVDAQRWLRIRVTNLATGRGKVNVNIPLSWVRFGLALGAGFVPELEDVDIEDVITSLDQDVAGHIVQVEDVEDNQRVEIYIE
jgi:hypothetical protein